MLINQYMFFKEQSKKLLELQDDYRNYITALRRVFDSQKAENQEVESIIEEKKKPFIVINREKKYLRQSFLDFINKKKINKNIDFKAFYNKLNKQERLFKKVPKKVAKISLSKPKVYKKNIYYRKNNNVNLTDAAKKFIWPIDKNEFWISSFFGLRKVRKGYSFHYGIDMAAIKGTIVRAAASGTVQEACYSSGYGNTIVIIHDNKYKTRYAHLNTIDVKKGQQVDKGKRIGTVGATGSVRSSGKNRDASHLHFEVYVYGKQINPLYLLQ